MEKFAPSPFFIALFPFFFVGLWCAVTLMLSTMGWRQLADRFPAQDPPSGRRFWMQSAKVGPVRYGNCLTIFASPEGLHLSVWLPFRLGHPPLFLPWDVIRNATVHRLFWTENVTFDVGSPTVAHLQLSRKVFKGYEVIALPHAAANDAALR